MTAAGPDGSDVTDIPGIHPDSTGAPANRLEAMGSDRSGADIVDVDPTLRADDPSGEDTPALVCLETVETAAHHEDGPTTPARPTVSRMRRPGRSVVAIASELAIVATVYLLYQAGRGVTNDSNTIALRHARRVLDFERDVGLAIERTIQSSVAGSRFVIEMLNRFYVGVHFPATIAFLVWAYARHYETYRKLRVWFVTVTLSALVIHLAYPLAPPRMLPGFIDTLHVFGPSIYPRDTTESVANQFAAMPSLHFGWALMVAIGVIVIHQSRWRFLALVHPTLTFFAIVATANHYVLDALIAAGLLTVCGLVQVGLRRLPVAARVQARGRALLGRATTPTAARMPVPHQRQTKSPAR